MALCQFTGAVTNDVHTADTALQTCQLCMHAGRVLSAAVKTSMYRQGHLLLLQPRPAAREPASDMLQHVLHRTGPGAAQVTAAQVTMS